MEFSITTKEDVIKKQALFAADLFAVMIRNFNEPRWP